MHDTIVFLGPSLPLAQAIDIFPDTEYRPPVQCGDIIKCLKDKPKRIAIIDGYFENTAAVWHKEILYAMEQGVQIYGASSMGALRAAELSDFGMIGIGKIFNLYYDSSLTDDDEVAILHLTADQHYKPLSEALVNIRQTLEHAKTLKIINEDLAQHLLHTAKSTYYPNRHYSNIINATLKHIPKYEDALSNFQTWIQAGNNIDQKAQDAISLLSFLQKKTSRMASTSTTPKSLFLRTLIKNICCEKKGILSHLEYIQEVYFDTSSTVPPENEKITYYQNLLMQSEFSTPIQPGTAKKIAKIYITIKQHLENQALCIGPEHIQHHSDHFRRQHHLLTKTQVTEWLDNKNMTQAMYQDLVEMLCCITHIALENNTHVLPKNNFFTFFC